MKYKMHLFVACIFLSTAFALFIVSSFADDMDTYQFSVFDEAGTATEEIEYRQFVEYDWDNSNSSYINHIWGIDKDGNPVWLYREVSKDDSMISIIGIKDNVLYFFRGMCIISFDITNGVKIWESKLETSNTICKASQRFQIAFDENKMLYICPSSGLLLISIDTQGTIGTIVEGEIPRNPNENGYFYPESIHPGIKTEIIYKHSEMNDIKMICTVNLQDVTYSIDYLFSKE